MVRDKAVDADIERAAALLREGGLVAFPTETVYGLGCDGDERERDPPAFRREGPSSIPYSDSAHASPTLSTLGSRSATDALALAAGSGRARSPLGAPLGAGTDESREVAATVAYECGPRTALSLLNVLAVAIAATSVENRLGRESDDGRSCARRSRVGVDSSSTAVRRPSGSSRRSSKCRRAGPAATGGLAPRAHRGRAGPAVRRDVAGVSGRRHGSRTTTRRCRIEIAEVSTVAARREALAAGPCVDVWRRGPTTAPRTRALTASCARPTRTSRRPDRRASEEQGLGAAVADRLARPPDRDLLMNRT